MKKVFTTTTESLAAMARMSAHETVSGHTLSRSAFIESITSNPRRELRFGGAVFSPTNPSVSSNKTEASHPCNVIQNTSRFKLLLYLTIIDLDFIRFNGLY